MHRLDNPAMDALVPVPGHGGDADVAAAPVVNVAMGPTPPRSLFGPTCGPCHAVHAIEGSDRPRLWAARRTTFGNTDVDRRCLGCHGPGGGAKRPEIFQHPEAAFASLKYAVDQPVATDPVSLFPAPPATFSMGRKSTALAN